MNYAMIFWAIAFKQDSADLAKAKQEFLLPLTGKEEGCQRWALATYLMIKIWCWTIVAYAAGEGRGRFGWLKPTAIDVGIGNHP